MLRKVFYCFMILILPALTLAQEPVDSVQKNNIFENIYGLRMVYFNIPIKSDFELPVSGLGTFGFYLGLKYNNLALQCGLLGTKHYLEQTPDSLFEPGRVIFNCFVGSFKYYFPIKKFFQPYCFIGADFYSLGSAEYGLFGSSWVSPLYSHFGIGFDFFVNNFLSIGVENLIKLVDYSSQKVGDVKQTDINKHLQGVYCIPSLGITFHQSMLAKTKK